MAYRLAVFVTVTFLVLYLLNVLVIRFGNHRWWSRKWVRSVFKRLPLLFLTFGLVWMAGTLLDSLWLTRVGSGLLVAIHIYLLAVLIAAIVAAPLNLCEKLYDLLTRGALKSATETSDHPASLSRRRFLHSGLAALPALTATTASVGIVSASSPPRMPRLVLTFPDLPEALRGLTLLHISDIHIGPYIALSDLEALVERARSLQPDFVFVSGDICDHIPSYLESLKTLEQLRPPYGTYASLGNHEYFRGIEAVRSSFEKSDIPLLVDDGIAVDVRGERIFVSGADDPLFMRGPESAAKLRRSVEASQKSAAGTVFRVLMSHRSVAFDTAAQLGVDLTLSGHTHGFQLGAGGRSLFESSYPDRYIWGHYAKGDRQLYTSAGVGHWFPFRLGCPPEAPLIVLEKGCSKSIEQLSVEPQA